MEIISWKSDGMVLPIPTSRLPALSHAQVQLHPIVSRILFGKGAADVSFPGLQRQYFPSISAA
jgi:hypothetical protein